MRALDADPRKSRRWQALRLTVLARETHCWLCGDELDPTAPARTPQASEVDHVLPWTLRPDLAFDPDNLRATHKRCNSAKRDRLVGAPPPRRRSRDW